jgi:hypothetical protein
MKEEVVSERRGGVATYLVGVEESGEDAQKLWILRVQCHLVLCSCVRRE